MKRFFPSCWILIAAGAAISTASFTACDDDKDNTPVYQPVEMTVCTLEEAHQETPPYPMYGASQLVLFSETLPFLSLQNAMLTIYPLSEKRFYLSDFPQPVPGEEDQDTTSPTSTISFWFFHDMQSVNWPSYIFTGKKGCSSHISYYIPKEEGDYDFYFRIDCPEKGLYFQTPNYRYTMRLIEGGLYDASITTLE